VQADADHELEGEGEGQRRAVQGQRGVEMPGIEIEHLRGRHHQAEQAGNRQPDE
jgi:hypothetical protein